MYHTDSCRATSSPVRTGPLFTSMFLHGGWMHLIGNMLYLHIFGDNVEDRLGHVRFLLMYLLAGPAAGLAQVADQPALADARWSARAGPSPASRAPTSSSIPRARVVTLVPIFLFLQVVEIPAFFFLLFWFVFQLLLGVGSLGSRGGGGVAFWAHIGGFVAGMVARSGARAPRPGSVAPGSSRRPGGDCRAPCDARIDGYL